MTLTELKYIVAVAREKHFGHAADACYVSQPTLSVAIKKLEEELDVKLFERSAGEVTVTPLVSNIAHFMPPNAMQPTYQTHGLLATNDARVLGAFLENDKIQFVHNTMDTATGHCAVYHGIISNVACSGLINALGCGSKVNTAACPPLRRADCTAASMTTRCPR